MQKSTPSYVHTHTTYGSDTDGSWGEASSVVEDYGGIGRTTTTNGYTTDGKADDVTDAAGHEFVTSYDLDGVVQSVTRTDVTPHVALVTYAYGSTDATLANGMPTSITDGLSGVVQALAYDAGGSGDGGIGQVSEVDETNGTDIYHCYYGYDGAGNRLTAEYATPAATTTWKYEGYNRVGTPDNPKYAFQTLTLLNSGNRTAEAMHYLFDSAGRLEAAAFAQTPTATGPLSDGSWYSASYPASSRALAFYTYDPAGRIAELDHFWQNLVSGSYVTNYIVGNSCSYELSSSNRGLKTANTFYSNSSGTKTTAWSESYGYDNNLDYLTSASYGDSQPNASQTWTYDAAGNRASDYTGSSWAYDNLNRMSANGAGTSMTNDILGNRTALGSGFGHGTYTWDCLNRMTASVSPGGSVASMGYTYRADGMRVEKILHSGMYQVGGGEIDDVYSRYRYDGQMPMQTYVIKADSSTVETDHGLGARGIDEVILKTTPSGGSTTTSYSFPIYDAHGNEVATLARYGSNPSVANQRAYGAWGEIRQGATSGGPRGRYCGAVGHVQDDESGLVYMRARYYEPTTGRFASEDAERHGRNWATYANANPISNTDPSGHDITTEGQAIIALLTLAWKCFLGAQSGAWSMSEAMAYLTNSVRDLKWMTTEARLTGQDLMSDGELDEEASAFMGDAGAIEQKIGDIKEGLGAESMAWGVAAQLGMKCVEAMLEILADS